MQPYLLADSATTAAWAGAIGQWAGALVTAAAVLVALWLPRHERKRAEAARCAQLAAEVMASVIDLKSALEVIRTRSANRQTRAALLIAAAAEMFLDSRRPNGQRLAGALNRAIDWNQAANDFAYAAISAPLARTSTALVQISLIDSEDLRRAADGIREVVADMMTSFGHKTTYAKTANQLDQAVADFRAVTIRVTGVAER